MKHSFKVELVLVLNILLFAQPLFGQDNCAPQNVKTIITATQSGRRTVSDGGAFLQTLDFSLSLIVSVYGTRPVRINDTIRYTADSCVGNFIYHGVAKQDNRTQEYNLDITFNYSGSGGTQTYLIPIDTLLKAEWIRLQSPIANNAVFEGFSYNRAVKLMSIYIENPRGWLFGNTYTFNILGIPDTIEVSHYHQLDNKFAFKEKKLLATNLNKPFFSVSGDGSEASMIVVKRPKTMHRDLFKKLSARIQGDPLATNVYQNGQFSISRRNADTIIFRYKHPEHIGSVADFYRSINMEVRDTIKDCPFKIIPIRVFRASVLMVHGLWSDAKAFSDMEDYLTNANNREFYKWQTYKVDYCSTNDSYFCTNSPKVFDGIDVLIRNGIGQTCAVGKIDVVCHSMGGILTRLYIQSPSYENDIHKLITINTPHYGSPIADFVMERSITTSAICSLLKNFNRCQGTCEDGALNDLRMEGSAIRNLNTGNFSSIKVPVHSVVTYRDLADFQAALNRVDILESIPGADMFAPFRILFGFADIAKSVGCIGNDLFDGEPNDVIVGLRSQTGGLIGEKVTTVPGQMHMGSQQNGIVIQSVRSLLNTPTNSAKFSTYGYQSRPAGYGYSLNIPECIEAAAARAFSVDQLSRINIEVSQSLIPNDPNHHIRITGTGPPNVTTLLLLLEIDRQHMIYGRKQGNTSTFNIDMPLNSFGNKDITIVGYDFNNHKIVVGKNTVNVQPLLPITTLRIDPSVIYVMKDKVTPIRVIGTDSTNKAYDLTNLAGLNFQFTRNYARREGNGVFGVNLGTDNLRISFNGVSTDNIPVNVLDCRTTTPIPIELLSFTGKAHKGRNELAWVTASEHNNKGFFIERSADGQSWESIGWISGKGTSTAIVYYEFSDAFPLDIGYYRLQQLDFDGKITFSRVITLVQPSDNETIIYPNPARDYLTVEWQAENTEGVEKNLSIVNAIGTTVRQLKTTAKNVQINVSDLPNGVYILRIEQANKATASVKRFVLMK